MDTGSNLAHLPRPGEGVRVEYREISPGNIEVGEQDIRAGQDDEALTELAADIGAHGLLQPIGVQALEGGRYQLLWGGRRLAAHKLLRRDAIMAAVHHGDPQVVRAVALRENIHRLQMSLEAECRTVAQLHHEQGKSPDQIATMLGKGRAWVLRRLAIPSMLPELQDLLMAGRITLAAAEQIARLPDASDQAYLANWAEQQRATTAQVATAVEQLLDAPNTAEAVEAGVRAARSTAQLQPVMVACAACGTPRTLDDLVVVRICAGGCKHD